MSTNAYLVIENHKLESFKVIDDYMIIETKDTDHLPKKFKIWGDAVIEIDWYYQGLIIVLKGGHHVTKKIIKNNYD